MAPPATRIAAGGSGSANLLLNNNPLSSLRFAPATTASLPPAMAPASSPATGAPSSFAKTSPTGADGAPKTALGLSLPTAPPASSGGRMTAPAPLVSLRAAVDAQLGSPAISAPLATNPGPANSSLSPKIFDHATARGACASCHDGRTASGKPLKHVLTN